LGRDPEGLINSVNTQYSIRHYPAMALPFIGSLRRHTGIFCSLFIPDIY